ncbi:MAG: pyridoxamine 5'-phosphate oxidase family protein [Acidimicrobiales bacterium]
MTLSSDEALRRVYQAPKQRSLDKEVDHLDAHCCDFIAHSPFAVLASGDADGVDVSPKGGPPGFVTVLDEHRLALPDMSGNNRLDSLRHIVRSGHVSLLFMVPGVDETMRVVGSASVTTDPAITERCVVADLRPLVAVVVEVQTAFIHCAKALRRSGLWDAPRWPSTDDMASPACMLRDHVGAGGSVEDSARYLEESYLRTTWAMGGEAAPR